MKKLTLLSLILYLMVYILPLGVRPLVIPDETRYAEISREMLETGDWVVPRLNGLRYFEKPVLGYWLNAASIYLFGENAFAVRLPSALAAGISAFLTGLLVWRFAGGYRVALLTAAGFLTCFEVFGIGTFCVLDSVFSMFITATMVAFYFAGQTGKPGKQAALLALAGIFTGLAFLTKGFLAFVLPVIIVVPFLLWQGKGKELLRIFWIPLVTAVLTALPWCLAIHWREGDFWHYFFWTEHIQRFLEPNGGQHSSPFWLFIPVLLAGGLPWTGFLPCALWGIRNIRPKVPFIRFALCWLVFPFVFFSASRGKLSTYILPCFPPFIILTITGLLHYFAAGKQKAFQLSVRSSVILLVVTIIVLVLVQMGLFKPLNIYEPRECWKWILLVLALLVNIVMLNYALGAADSYRRMALCGLAPIFLLGIAHLVWPDQIATRKMPGQFLLEHTDQIPPNALIVSDNYLTPAVDWYYHRNDIYILGNDGEFSYGLNYDDVDNKHIRRKEFSDFIEQYSKQNRVMLITSIKRYPPHQIELPKPTGTISNMGFVIVEYSLHQTDFSISR
ncbi:MAG: phospholipid carrier-dependent glycosyltransferase [Sedimentisphaerales bacterium]|nr:phospholipid carrier-dependent glycosyltransferase [Sedimentisphaerales bacterium]